MIDTIVLTLTQSDFQLSNPEAFIPSARWTFNDYPNPGMQSKQNPTRKELLKGIYKPRLKLYYQHINPLGRPELALRIETSLPKLLFMNNFNELRQKDFQKITEALVSILAQMGIITTTAALTKAPVATIHYAKNICLTDGSTPYHYIQKIREANIKLSLDINQTDYRNEGHSLKWHCNSYEVIFYDKIRDLEKAKQSSKRTIDKDGAVQLNLLEAFAHRKRFEVFRMEVRLNKRTKIKKLLHTLGIKSDLSFQSLFKQSTAKKILLHYLDELESKRPALLNYRPKSDKELLAMLTINNLDLNPKRIFQLYGLKKASDSMTLREMRVMFSRTSKTAWYRLISEANKVQIPGLISPFEQIRETILKFKPNKFINYNKE